MNSVSKYSFVKSSINFKFLFKIFKMRKVFDSINQINLKKDENRNLVYIPLKNKLYIYENRQGVFEKLSEITNEDEIMNFHLLKNSLYFNLN